MTGPLEPLDPSQHRVSDQDRHRVAEQLREAAGDGRIDFTELDQRLEATYAARTYAELVPVTADLPDTDPQARPSPRESPASQAGKPERHVAIMSGVERKGHWVVPARMTVVAVMGGVDLDMRRADFAAREVVLTVNTVMGGAHIKVAPGVTVVMEGTGIMGGYAGPGDSGPADPDAPTLRVRGVAVMGGVHVERKG
ncbi:MAG: DUF1707 SHOCT-like domain-containing protein [Marmoricola sp.]